MSDLKVGSPQPTGSLAQVGSLSPAGATVSGAADARTSVPVASASKSEVPASASTGALVRTASLDAGPQLVDSDRVEVIRSAIASGHYPLVPARIGDAMIAAGILLQTSKA